MEFNFDFGLLFNILAVAALMIANTVLRLAIAIKIEDFNLDELKRGLIKYGITLVGVAFFYVAGELCPNAGVEINGDLVTIDMALNLLSAGLITVYAAKCFENLRDIFADTELVMMKMAVKAERIALRRKHG